MSLGWVDEILVSSGAPRSRVAGLFDSLADVGVSVDEAMRRTAYQGGTYATPVPVPAAYDAYRDSIIARATAPLAAASPAALAAGGATASPAAALLASAASRPAAGAAAAASSGGGGLPSLGDFVKLLDVAGSRGAELIRADAAAAVQREDARTLRTVYGASARGGGAPFDLSGLLSSAVPLVVVVGLGAVVLRLVGRRR